MIRAVVFDLDDTLYDEVDYCRSGFEAVADFLVRVHKVPHASEDLCAAFCRQFDSGNREQTFDTALHELGVPSDPRMIAGLIRIYRCHMPKIRLPKDSRDTLTLLRRSYSLAVLTDGYLPAQRLKIRALGIAGYLKCILYTEHLGRSSWKPSPVGFVKVLDALRVRPDQAAYVGDNAAKDFIAPNVLGMQSIQVSRPLGLHDQPATEPSAAARHAVDSISRLPALLQSLD